jgi:hypothetical protein
MENGLVLFYSKDDVLYPVALTQEQSEAFQLLQPILFGGKIHVIFDKPQCTVRDLLKELKSESEG